MINDTEYSLKDVVLFTVSVVALFLNMIVFLLNFEISCNYTLGT